MRQELSCFAEGASDESGRGSWRSSEITGKKTLKSARDPLRMDAEPGSLLKRFRNRL
jgi:hypothetical protein